jgi:hypothetical protein
VSARVDSRSREHLTYYTLVLQSLHFRSQGLQLRLMIIIISTGSQNCQLM